MCELCYNYLAIWIQHNLIIMTAVHPIRLSLLFDLCSSISEKMGMNLPAAPIIFAHFPLLSGFLKRLKTFGSTKLWYCWCWNAWFWCSGYGEVSEKNGKQGYFTQFWLIIFFPFFWPLFYVLPWLKKHKKSLEDQNTDFICVLKFCAGLADWWQYIVVDHFTLSPITKKQFIGSSLMMIENSSLHTFI